LNYFLPLVKVNYYIPNKKLAFPKEFDCEDFPVIELPVVLLTNTLSGAKSDFINNQGFSSLFILINENISDNRV